VAEGGKVMLVPSRNTNLNCFEDRGEGVMFSDSKDVYLKQGIEVKTFEDDDDNSIQFVFIYVQPQQPRGQLQS
jgi:hypothetical protein